jgi:hypothetical protein
VMTSIARNENEDMIALVVRSSGVCVWRESGARGLFCDGAFGRNLASSPLSFSHLIYLIKICYKYCTFRGG